MGADVVGAGAGAVLDGVDFAGDEPDGAACAGPAVGGGHCTFTVFVATIMPEELICLRVTVTVPPPINVLAFPMLFGPREKEPSVGLAWMVKLPVCPVDAA